MTHMPHDVIHSFGEHGHVVIPDFLGEEGLNVLRQVLITPTACTEGMTRAVIPTTFCMCQECDVIVEHSYDQLARHQSVEKHWEANVK